MISTRTHTLFYLPHSLFISEPLLSSLKCSFSMTEEWTQNISGMTDSTLTPIQERTRLHKKQHMLSFHFWKSRSRPTDAASSVVDGIQTPCMSTAARPTTGQNSLAAGATQSRPESPWPQTTLPPRPRSLPTSSGWASGPRHRG